METEKTKKSQPDPSMYILYICARIFLLFSEAGFNVHIGPGRRERWLVVLERYQNYQKVLLSPNLQTLKGTVSRDFCFWFFYESVSPQPQSIPLGPASLTPAANFATSSPCAVDTGGK